MANDPVLRMLGLARRAGKLAYGDELVREVCFAHKARCVFLAGDAGASTAKKGAFYAEKANVPCVQLPHGKIELGTSGGAIVAVTDIGLASSAVEKLASEHEEYAETAKLLSEKNARIQSRKGIKKQKNRAETETEKPVEPEKREEIRPKTAEKRPFRKADGEKRPYRKDGERPFRRADGEKRPYRKDGERPFRKTDGEKRPYRKDGERPFRKADGEKRPYRKDGERPFRRDSARKPHFTGEKRSFRNKT